MSPQDVDPGLPKLSGGEHTNGKVDTSSIDFLLQEQDKKHVPNTSEHTFKGLDKRYPYTFVGLDNEEIYD
ncbi:hypothetical protein D3C72_2364530 [compost metagenome]